MNNVTNEIEGRILSLYNSSNLTRRQLQIWVGQKLTPDIPVYNMLITLTIHGNIKPSVFKKAVQQLIFESDALRTVIGEDNGVPQQRVLPDFPYSLDVIDFSDNPDPEEAFELFFRKRGIMQLDLRKRLFDFALIKTASDKFIFYSNLHHLIVDGWSEILIAKRLSVLYNGILSGNADGRRTAHTFNDYIIAERRYRHSEQYKRSGSFWESKLAASIEPTVFYGKTPASGTTKTERLSYNLGKEISSKLLALSTRKEAASFSEEQSIYIIFAALLFVFIHKISGNHHLAIGSPFLNRISPEFKETIGLLMEVCVIQADLEADETFLTLLEKVSREVIQVSRHAQFGVDNTIQKGSTRSYDIMLNFPHASIEDFGGYRCNFEWRHSGDWESSNYFVINVHDFNSLGSYTLQFDFNCDLFSVPQRKRAVQHFFNIIGSFIEDPSQRLDQVSLLSEDERHKLLVQWNNTAAKYPIDSCIHTLIEDQAAQVPDAVAVVDEKNELTYYELNRRANQCANYLRSLKVGPETLVGVYMERSSEMLIGLLGILKSGGAYLPLDPAYPKDRLEFMLQETLAPVILTEAKHVMYLPENSAEIICLDSDWKYIESQDDKNFATNVSSENLAYTIYTSGSTGKPKGVQIRHRSVVNFLTSMKQAPGLSAADTMLSLTTLAFDISVLELFLPLAVGAKVAIAGTDIISDGAKLQQIMHAYGVTVMQATPVTWKILLVTGWPGDKKLKVLCGGEALSRDLANQLSGRVGSLWNVYGPTETTVWSTVHKVSPGSDPVLIGKPIANTTIYILDKNMQPVPIGVPGELCIGGDGLARAYFKRPELTSEKFVSAKFPNVPKARIYKTGDLARFHEDGNLECLGRIDHQIKIRGFRIELGEIEAVLGECVDVREATVIAREDTPGDKRLVAYIVSTNGEQPSVTELKRELRKALPEYMVPTAFMFLKSMPLTPNGKVDRKALPEPDRARPALDQDYVPPRKIEEELLAGIWKELLALERISIHDNFFELGGNSLLATQLMSRIAKSFNCDARMSMLFESPTIEGLAKELLEFRQEEINSKEKPPRRTPGNNQCPLSFSQLRQWFLQRLEPNSYSYNIPAVFRLRGKLSIPDLENSFNDIVKRHEILRTSFSEINGQPMQMISPYQRYNLAFFDYQNFAENDKDTKVREKVQEEIQWIFDLSHIPLIRMTLIRLNTSDHILVLVIHHIISDGWSLGVFINELETFYNASMAGQPVRLPELPVQFGDYALWERSRMKGDFMESRLAFWKTQLQGSRALLHLPTDRPRPTFQSARGKSKKFTIEDDLTNSIKSQSRNLGGTPFIYLLTALKVLLSRYTGEDDISVGTYVANRNHMDIEKLIGFFVNTIVLRTNLSDGPTFQESLGRVSKTATEALANQELPFEKLLDALRLKRTTSHTPLFQIMFNFQNKDTLSLNLADLSIAPMDFELTTTHFDLTLWIYDIGSRMSGWLEYNTDLFEESTITRMVENFKNLLEVVTDQPKAKISTLPFLPKTELQKLLFEWNGQSNTIFSPPKNSFDNYCIHELFEQCVEHYPSNIAVISEDEQLSYRELNERANQLAHYLIRFGITSESLVGLCIKRSIKLIIGLMGILKAGAAYVPLDPDYPRERLAYMLDDTSVSIVLTERELLSSLPKHTGKTILLDQDWETISHESHKNPGKYLSPENIAYIIYTSGSTGKPKGVMVQHRSLVNYTQVATSIYKINSQDRVLQFASVNFDTSAEEIYPCLSNGATLLLRSDLMMGSTSFFLETCRRWGITVLNLPTAYWHELVIGLETDDVTFPSTISLVIIGGEKALPDRLKIWYKHVDHNVRLMNTYGPTETTIVATMSELSNLVAQMNSGRELPIGFPIPNARIYILDKNMQPVPIGVPGELYIGGIGLARGYLNAPGQTAEKFVPNPFSMDTGARLYKTGDRVRFFPDGSIEFLDRIDNQVKIRGYRIETTEIETVIRQHPKLTEAVVIAREDIPGSRRLVAYLVPQNGTILPIGELRSFIKEKLPEYMVPSAFVLLEELPKGPGGKIDIHSLPAPAQDRAGLDTEYSAPQSSVEKILSDIWSNILKIDQIGIHDNFFELGGDSILSLQVISRANQAGILLTPVDMVRYQTIAELETVASSSVPVLSEQEEIRGPIQLTPYQHWFFEQDLPDPHHWNMSIILEIQEKLDYNLIPEVLLHLQRHHDALRLCFEKGPAMWTGRNAGIEEFPPPRFVIADLSGMSKDEQRTAMDRIVAEQQAGLNLLEGPLTSIVLFELGNHSRDRLFITVHHMVIDGISLRIFLEDFEVVYRELGDGKLPTLPPKTTSYKRWADRLVEYTQSGALNHEMSFWVEQGMNGFARLPVDFSNGMNTWESVRVVQKTLSQKETHDLLYEAPAAYSTQINDILLTALLIAFSKWTNSQSFLFDLEGHGRIENIRDVDLSRTIGCFTSVFPVLLETKETTDSGELLKMVKESLRSIPNHGIGYGAMRYLSHQPDIAEKLRKSPRAEVCFNYLGQFDQVLPASSPFSMVNETIVSVRSLGEPRYYLLEILGRIIHGELQLEFIYSKNIHKSQSIEIVAGDFIDTLRSLIQHCMSGSGGFTPSDFPAANINQKTLDQVISKLSS